MKTQVMIVVALLIPVALSSNSDMVVEAQLGPGDCYDGCTTGCVQRDREYILSSFLIATHTYSISINPF